LVQRIFMHTYQCKHALQLIVPDYKMFFLGYFFHKEE
jgi:hypothetical protein